MINLDRVKHEFNKFVDKFDSNDGKIRLKIVHTYGVVAMSKYIAENLNLSNEDIELAQLIAYLHDIARFPQARDFGDYRDYKTFDHADLACQMLFEQGMIRTFIEDDTYDSIIAKAIKNHNKFSIENGLNQRELLHAQLIKDADKLDNFRVKINHDFESILNTTKNKLENDVISKEIYNQFMNNQLIISSERKTDLDCWVSYIAFIFDINFTATFSYIKEHDYINLLCNRIDYKRIDTLEAMEKIRVHALEYIDKWGIK